MSAPKGTGRVRIDDRGNSVWEFTDPNGGQSTVRTERVLALGDALSLVQTGVHAPIATPAPPVAAVSARPAVAQTAAPAASSFAAIETKPPRKPMSRQELQKLSEEIVRQRQLREAMQKKDR